MLGGLAYFLNCFCQIIHFALCQIQLSACVVCAVACFKSLSCVGLDNIGNNVDFGSQFFNRGSLLGSALRK